MVEPFIGVVTGLVFILGGDLYFPRQSLKSFPLYLSAHKGAENGPKQTGNRSRVANG